MQPELLESRTLLAGDLGFVNVFGAANSLDEGNAVVVDSSGNHYVTGGFGGTVDFDPGTGVRNLTAANGSTNCYIAKYSASDTLLWVKTIGGSGLSYAAGRSLALDPAGNLWIAGRHTGTADLDPGPGIFSQSSVGTKSEFLLKLTSDGDFLWAGNIDQTDVSDNFDGEETITSIATDVSGNLFAVGRFSGTADFDPGPGTFNATSVLNGSVSTADSFVLKINNSGAFQWAKTWGGNVTNGYGDEASAVATDPSGNAYVTGYFAGTEDLDPGSAVQSYSTEGGSLDQDSFTSKFDASGNLVWVKVWGGIAFDHARAIAVDASGVYLAGGFSSTVDFNPGSGVANFTAGLGQSDIFVTKLSTLGVYQWTSQLGGAGSYPEYASALALDDNGDIYVAGQFSTGADFDPSSGVSTLDPTGGPAAAFVCQLDNSGQLVSAVQSATNGGNAAAAITLDQATNQLYTIATFRGTVDFDPGMGVTNRTSADSSDAYVQGLNFSSVPSPVTKNDGVYSALEEGSVTVAAPGVLGNDTDPGSLALTAVLNKNATHGSVSLSPDGSFTYQPNADYNGPDSFTYRASNSGSNSDVTTVSLNVTAVNDAPSFTKGIDVAGTDEDGAQAFANWASSITAGPADEAQQQVHFVVQSKTNAALFTAGPAISASGTLTFSPAPNAKGISTVTIALVDDGGTTSGGINTSAPQTFTIEIDKPHPWHNLVQAFDVTGQGGVPDHLVTPVDALAIINYINAFGSGPVPSSWPLEIQYLDTSGGSGHGDNMITPDDALVVINYLNAFGADTGGPAGEGEGLSSSSDASSGFRLPATDSANLQGAKVGSAADQATPQNSDVESIECLLALLAADTASERSGKRR